MLQLAIFGRRAWREAKLESILVTLHEIETAIPDPRWLAYARPEQMSGRESTLLLGVWSHPVYDPLRNPDLELNVELAGYPREKPVDWAFPTVAVIESESLPPPDDVVSIPDPVYLLFESVGELAESDADSLREIRENADGPRVSGWSSPSACTGHAVWLLAKLAAQ